MSKIIQRTFNEDTGEVYYEKTISPINLVRFRPSSKFVKQFCTSVPKFSTPAFYQIYVMLMPFLEMRTNRLCYIKQDKLQNTPLTRVDIEKITGISKPTVLEFIKECRNKGYIKEVIGKQDGRVLYFNPMYALNGMYISYDLFILFYDTELNKFITDEDKILIRNYLESREESIVNEYTEE